SENAPLMYLPLDQMRGGQGGSRPANASGSDDEQIDPSVLETLRNTQGSGGTSNNGGIRREGR
ncbi:protease modulator HflK, partial [Halomonas sp. 707D4]|nr:protease modulator HflK [Halomonas sp. 707D4]